MMLGPRRPLPRYFLLVTREECIDYAKALLRHEIGRYRYSRVCGDYPAAVKDTDLVDIVLSTKSYRDIVGRVRAVELSRSARARRGRLFI